MPGESQGRQSLVGCRLGGRTELDTTEAMGSVSGVKEQSMEKHLRGQRGLAVRSCPGHLLPDLPASVGPIFLALLLGTHHFTSVSPGPI